MYIEPKHPTETERMEIMDYAKAMDAARLQGRLEAFAMAMTECHKSADRGNGAVGARDCMEIRKAIDILHLETLRQMQAA
jgi:hypothetical protein